MSAEIQKAIIPEAVESTKMFILLDLFCGTLIALHNFNERVGGSLATEIQDYKRIRISSALSVSPTKNRA
jgi:hypothetical protein